MVVQFSVGLVLTPTTAHRPPTHGPCREITRLAWNTHPEKIMEIRKQKLQFLVIMIVLFGVITGCQLSGTTYAAELIPTYTPQTIIITPNSEATPRAYAPPLTQTPTSSSPLFPTATLNSNQVGKTIT